jgi:hypothetical protein
MRIIVQHDDGTEIDITEGVQIAYDCTVGSMDWGSGFLAVEEVDAMVRLSQACRFSDFEKIAQDVFQERQRELDNHLAAPAYYKSIGSSYAPEYDEYHALRARELEDAVERARTLLP